MSVDGNTDQTGVTATSNDEYVRDVKHNAAFDQTDLTISNQSYRYISGDGRDIQVLIQYLRYYDGRKISFSNNDVIFASTGGRDYFENTVYFETTSFGSSEYSGNNINFNLGPQGGKIAYSAYRSNQQGDTKEVNSSFYDNRILMNGSDVNDYITYQITATSVLSNNDIFVEAGGGKDIINGYIEVAKTSEAKSNNVILSGGDGDDSIYFRFQIAQLETPIIPEGNIFELLGGAGNDQIDFFAFTDYLVSGREETGLQNSVIIDGGDGYDTLSLGLWNAGGSPYYVDFSQNYETTISGITIQNIESVIISTSIASDTIIGGNGNDSINGSLGADSMAGGLGDDFYYVDDARDIVSELATQGTDTIFTRVSMALSDEQSIERLVTYYPDELVTLEGNSFANTIIGGGRNDTLIGGGGSDRLTGGAGRDTFLYRTTSEAGLGANRDVIQDFVRGQDVVDLSAIQAVTGASTDQAFSFLGTGAYTGQAGQLRATQNGSVAVVQGDVNGDMRSDFQIYLANITASTLQATDFTL